jgi:hypothetical protein
MVTLLFGNFTNAVGKFQGFPEIRKLELFFQALFVCDPPAATQPVLKLPQRIAFQRRGAAGARFTFLLCQF